jgi:hypothetical protein
MATEDKKLISDLYSQIEIINSIMDELKTDLESSMLTQHSAFENSILTLEPKVFLKWSGPDGLEEYIKHETGCRPFAAAGINPRPAEKTTILRSVEGTKYYADDLRDINYPIYTLYGHNGDQDEGEKKFNEPLLNPTKTNHIYLYQVKTNRKQTEYLWYGKYVIETTNKKLHPGKDGVMRTIILLSLKRV